MNSGGLIEAVADLRSSFQLFEFPPVNSGGLIEAVGLQGAGSEMVRVSAGEFRRPH